MLDIEKCSAYLIYFQSPYQLKELANAHYENGTTVTKISQISCTVPFKHVLLFSETTSLFTDEGYP